jgi:hypothetical protein
LFDTRRVELTHRFARHRPPQNSGPHANGRAESADSRFAIGVPRALFKKESSVLVAQPLYGWQLMKQV